MLWEYTKSLMGKYKITPYLRLSLALWSVPSMADLEKEVELLRSGLQVPVMLWYQCFGTFNDMRRAHGVHYMGRYQFCRVFYFTNVASSIRVKVGKPIILTMNTGV